jgi:hypothetical protein
VIQKVKAFKATLTRHVSGTEAGHVRPGRPRLLIDCILTACEALHVIQLVNRYTSATVPVYANVACPRGNHTQLSTCYDTLIAPLTPIHNGVSSRRISL